MKYGTLLEYWAGRPALRHVLASLGLSLILAASMVTALTVPKALKRIEHEQSRFFFVQIAVVADTKSAVTQLFFDVGRGFNADDSVSRAIAADGNFHTIDFPLPSDALRGLRFDPLAGEGFLQLKNASLVNRNRELLLPIGPSDIKPLDQIRHPMTNDRLFSAYTIGDATDPQLRIQIPDDFDGHWRTSIWTRVLRVGIKQVCLFWFPVFLAIYLYGLERTAFGSVLDRTILHSPPSDSETIPRAWILTVSVLLYLSLLLLRSGENLFHPGLYMEDATLYFNRYYSGGRNFSFVLKRPHGYYNLLTNIVAWIASKQDVRLQPFLYHSVALGLSIGAAICLMFSDLFRTRWILLVVPIVLGLSGMNHIFYYTTLTYQIYIVVVWLLCIFFLPVPNSPRGFFILAIITALLIWSGPYSVVAVPAAFLFLLLFRDKWKCRLMVWIIVCVLAYTLTAQGLARLDNLFRPDIARKMAATLLDQVFFLNLLGGSYWWKALLLVLLVGGTMSRLRTVPNYLRISAILFAIIVLSMAPFFLSKKVFEYSVFPCFVFIGQFFWLTWLLFSADRFILTANRSKLRGLLVAAAFLTLAIIDNWQHPEKGSAAVMTEMPRFLRTIHAAEQLSLADKGRYVILSYGEVRFAPTVRVGSRDEDAQRVKRNRFPIEYGRDFVVE